MSPVVAALRRLRTAAPAMLALAGLLAAGWTTALNGAAAPTTVAPLPTPQANAPKPSLPQYAPGGGLSAVRRMANPITSSLQRSRIDVLRYTVQQGDSVFGIAKRFDIKPETVLWGNYDALNDNPDLLKPGQDLSILPVDGVYYKWKAGDTLPAVAGSFGVTTDDLVDWPGNHIDPLTPTVAEGNWLVVPGGKRAFKQWLVPTIARGRAGVGRALGSGGCSGDFTQGAVGSGAFIWPSGNHYLSGNDYWSGHLGIDIAAGLGAPVWAADSGVVVYAGWSEGGYGNLVMIDHGNGYQTLYAHLNVLNVGCGQSVGKGQGIGQAGSTGNSTGAHLHFEVRLNSGFVDPWYVLP